MLGLVNGPKGTLLSLSHHNFCSVMVVTRRTSQLSRRLTWSTVGSFSSPFCFGVDHGRRHLSLVRVGGGLRRRDKKVIAGLGVGVSTIVAASQGTQAGPRRLSVRIDALQSQRSHVIKGRGGRHQENQVIGVGVGVSGTSTVAATQGTQVSRRPLVGIDALRSQGSRVIRDMEPSVLLPPSLKSSVVVAVTKTKRSGNHSCNSISPLTLNPCCGSTHVSPRPDSFSINSGPFTPTKLRLCNSTPDTDKTLPLPTPVQQSLDRCILHQRQLCRRWDVDSGQWIRPPMPFFDEDHRYQNPIN